MEDSDGWSIDADLGFAPLEELGWAIEAVAWRSANIDWDDFDAVYIGTPWDYPEEPGRFLELLESIDKSRATLVNNIELVRWTIPKTYLRDLESKGVKIVPSRWHDCWSAGLVEQAFAEFGVNCLIVKPVVSSNATDTFLIDPDSLPAIKNELKATFTQRALVIQPFVENIRSEGEYSLFYFLHDFSHAICKIPREGDFRVQEERGAEIVAVVPDPALLHTANRVMNLVRPVPAYARVDFVRSDAGEFLLMELEVIEPSMYLRMDEEAPQRFAAAFDNYVSSMTGGSSQ